ncbi:hypothetical protein M8C21_009531 [Ambrosia artemisiifolia]|uniref:Rho-GAP domain-containing protein n=1 Tax=Ambrosia artemisiifolia TaxID=4212 RepID=A0AAD5BVY3_AMBAR|nr:hypothetical protein M8C21_009531 [Ambrosia artemisiifolia]
MNSHNIAMVFAPNMTQMADPMNALVYAVRVMNFLKTLILKTLRERQNLVIESSQALPRESPSDENSDQGPGLNPHTQRNLNENEEREHEFITEDDLRNLTVTEEYDGPVLHNQPVQSPLIETKTHEVDHTHKPKPVAKSSDPEKIEPVALVTNLSSINSQTEARR